jgi:hypothetical protein
MRHKNTVFHDVLKLVPWAFFNRLVKRHGSDDFVRKLTTRHQLIACFTVSSPGRQSVAPRFGALYDRNAR